jgi:hypothetical protein
MPGPARLLRLRLTGTAGGRNTGTANASGSVQDFSKRVQQKLINHIKKRCSKEKQVPPGRRGCRYEDADSDGHLSTPVRAALSASAACHPLDLDPVLEKSLTSSCALLNRVLGIQYLD